MDERGLKIVGQMPTWGVTDEAAADYLRGKEPTEIVVSYWSICRALGRAVSRMTDEDPWSSVEMWTVCAELEREIPNHDWSNAISDFF